MPIRYNIGITNNERNTNMNEVWISLSRRPLPIPEWIICGALAAGKTEIHLKGVTYHLSAD